MALYPPIRIGHAPVCMVLAAFALLAFDMPRVQPGFIAPLAFDAGSKPPTVAVGDFNGDGIPDLAVVNRGTAPAFIDGKVTVLLGNGDGTFHSVGSFFAGTFPTAVAVGDFNGDGSLDLVVTNNDFNSDTVTVLLGNGDGTFKQPQTYRAGYFYKPISVAIGDLNGDGILDLAVANQGNPGNHAVGVLLGNGDGTFQNARSFPAGTDPRSLAIGDLNGDGIPDLVVGGGTVSVLLGKGDGTFQAARNVAIGSPANALAVADFNSDGIPDLVVVSAGRYPYYLDGSVRVLLGNGDGTFQAERSFPTGSGSRSVAVADFNGDGIPDLAVADQGPYLNPTSGAVRVLLGNGDGTFQAARSFLAGGGPIVIGDFNGDGIADLAVGDIDSDTVRLLLGKGDGTFQAAPSFPTGSGPRSVAVADFNGDGILDLAVATNGNANGNGAGVSVLLGNGDGTFQAARSFAAGNRPHFVAVGDFNGDGIFDLAVAGGDNRGGTVSVLLGNGDGTFQAARTFPGGHELTFLAIGDFNGDGISDLAVTDIGVYPSNPATVNILLGNGDGTFQAARGYPAGRQPGSMAIGDFNGDGIPDFAVANTTDSTVSVLLGNGDGTFQAARSFPAERYADSVAIGDFNGDGILDLAVANSASDSVSVLLGNGDGTFQAAQRFAAGSGAFAVAVADFNGDGYLDLVVSSGSVRVLLGNGDGTFRTTSISHVAGRLPRSVAVGDFNGDGWPDLAVANSSSDDVSILLNDGKWPP